ncbi:ubiquitin-like domain-containing protein [Aggregatilinea lenta]|uniref:ubiquitin-like domain-containing protein n=1 Tax=Aggregatilinea lenta TaxID=913108 RepID=UPI0013C2C0E7|nr:ubiquitin-like domain-containing protein [Aggregatilinea lenta]
MTDDTLPSRLFRRRDRRVWVGALALLIVLLIGGAALAYRLTHRAVTISVEDRTWQVYTRAATVQELLDAENVLVEPGDLVEPGLPDRPQDGMTITVRRAHAVIVDVDGSTRTIRTMQVTPAEILAEQGVALDPYDVILVDGTPLEASTLAAQTWDAPPQTLTVQRSAAIVLRDGGQEQTLHTTALTVADALAPLDLGLYVGDRISPAPDSAVYDGMAIEIERSFPVTLAADGRQYATRVLGPTIGDALALIGVAPGGSDYTIPPLDTLPEPGMTIRLVRVTTALITEDEAIPASTLYLPAPWLLAGTQQVMAEGRDGLATVTAYVRYEDGEPVSRTVRDRQVVQMPVPRLVALGTRPAQ